MFQEQVIGVEFKEEKVRVIIAAAGTGGHINPGIAIANKIKEKEKDLMTI